MPRSTWNKYNFNGGELSPLLDGRVDFPKYVSGAKLLQNFIPTIYGPMIRRSGTHFSYSLGSERPFFLPFIFNESQSYVMCFTDQKLRFFTLDGIMSEQDNPSVIFELDTPYQVDDLRRIKYAQSGDVCYLVHPDYPVYKVSRTDSNTFTLTQVDFKNGPFLNDNQDTSLTIAVIGTDESVGATVTIEASSDLFTADSVNRLLKVAYFPEANMDTWEANSHTYSGDPVTYALNDYLVYQGNVYQVTGAASGNTLPTHTGNWSPLHDVGTESDQRLLLTFVGKAYGYVRITSFTDPTHVEAEIVKSLPVGYVTEEGTQTTDYWALGAFSDETGYPSAVTFHQQRLVFGGTNNNPQSIFGSTQIDVEDFERTPDQEDDESYFYTLSSTQRNQILWMKSGQELNVGTNGNEFIVRSGGSTITPTDVTIIPASNYGSRRDCDPVQSNGYILFPQVGGSRLRQLTYDYDSNRYHGVDLNRVANHLTIDGIDQMTVQNEPYALIWMIVNGRLLSMTYETEEDVYAWCQHNLANGEQTETNGWVETICAIPNDSKERLWLCVRRDGQYYVEYLEDFFQVGDSLENAWFLDSALAYDGEPTTTITGLDHLEGKQVSIMANGAVHPDRTVTNGEIELAYEATHVVIGIPFVSIWQSMRLEGGTQDGVGQGKSKRIANVILRLNGTGAGMFFGAGSINYDNEAVISPEISQMSQVLTRRAGVTTQYEVEQKDPTLAEQVSGFMDQPPELIYGDTYKLGIEGGWSTEYMFRIEHRLPTPATVVAVLAEVFTSER